MDDDGLSPGRLMVVEQNGVYRVVSEEDPDDWIAAFTADAAFPARDWAERMAEIYNLRSREQETEDGESPPLYLGSHHPRP
jgi:hypothetical protein